MFIHLIIEIHIDITTLYEIHYHIRLLLMALSPVGDLHRSPTIGDMMFFFFYKMNMNHWIIE